MDYKKDWIIYHSDKTDKLDLKSILSDFVQDSVHR